MEQAITALGKDGSRRLRRQRRHRRRRDRGHEGRRHRPADRPITGQDAELAAIQRILAGEQYMTVYKAIKPEAEAAADAGRGPAAPERAAGDLTLTEVDNGSGQVPSVLLPRSAVTKDNVKDTIVKDGFWTLAQICTSEYAEACKAAGCS